MTPKDLVHLERILRAGAVMAGASLLGNVLNRMRAECRKILNEENAIDAAGGSSKEDTGG